MKTVYIYSFELVKRNKIYNRNFIKIYKYLNFLNDICCFLGFFGSVTSVIIKNGFKI